MSREDEETKKSHAGSWGRCFKRRVFSSFSLLRQGLKSTESLPPGRSVILKKKIPEEGVARIFLVDHSLHTPSFTFTRDSFRGKGGRWKKEEKHWLGILTTDADRSSRAKTLAQRKKSFFRIAHPSQSDSLAWVAFNTRKDEMTVMMLDLKLQDWLIWSECVR